MMETVLAIVSLVIIIPSSVLVLVGIIYGISEIKNEVKKRKERK